MVYAGAGIAIVGVIVASAWGQADFGRVLVDTRELFGLWALGLLVASMLLGPLTSVFPWIPLKSPLMYARRAIGVSALVFALLHVVAYLWSVLRRDWHELYTPGALWVAGLILGILASLDMLALGVTSRDSSVRKMGGRRWKRLHRTIYPLLAIVLLHALFVGADFGINRAPDVRGEADAGALVTFASLTAAWVVLFLLRRRKLHWIPRLFVAHNAKG